MGFLTYFGVGIVVTGVVLKLLYWYFNATVCIECYAIIRVKNAKLAGYRNKNMYLCRKCEERLIEDST